jgi:energy-converting hydrogenase A subunit M
MTRANTTIILVPEAQSANRRCIESEITESLRFNWLLKVEKAVVSDRHMPNDKEVKAHG